ncbi:c-type cytochrome [Dyella mobilis]|uniref:C-type cytochrome n=1 Tax=Dyella mobilis TaxID=1849582 RepID=A0ABS2KEI5_9GAMM|nr:c-type cytochrome [Dyella mobilis]MBM7129313.1 c-type cytochrome [Dyella mobilis]GLQ98607.1 cytochrome c [Dyella mobilis]
MKYLRTVSLIVAVSYVGIVSAAATDGATLAQRGNGHGAAPCMACHAPNGGGMAAAGFPRLAGLPDAYLRKQLEDFANGSRANATMQPVAQSLSDDERDAVADYYSKLPVPAQVPAPPLKNDVAQSGQMLATRGRWSENLPACEQCHGPGGIGVGDHFPPLVGQSATYIANELHAWQGGSRHNDPLQLMQHVAANLSDADITAISTWYAAQPMAPKEQQP